MSVSPPNSIGPYRLEEVLGRGGMGEVWAAHDERLDRRVAMKYVRQDTEGDERKRERFRREALAAARIAHPSVVPVFDVLQDEAGDWIVMEYVDGPTLHALVEEEPLALPEALQYGRQIAQGLAAAHDLCLVHRDLKTENVMIAPSGHAKILDFGLVKVIQPAETEESLTVHGQVMGTIRAMSPEQARGFAVDARSDLFSLGTLLYEITTGISPFVGQTPLDTMSRVVTHEPPPVDELRPGLPLQLSNLIQNLLEKAPERRPPDATRVAAELERMAAELSARRYRFEENLDQKTRTYPETSDETILTGSIPRLDAAELEEQVANPIAKKRLLPLAALLFLLIGLVLVGGILLPNPPIIHDPALEEALRAVESAEKRDRSTLEVLAEARRLLSAYDDPKSLDQATESLQRLVAEQPESAAAHAILADAYGRKFMMENDRSWLERSLGLARQAVALDSHLATTHVALGAALRLSGESSQAADALDRALELEPGNARALLEKADLSMAAGGLAEAEAMIQGVIDAGRAEAEHFDLLGIIHVYGGDYEDAESALRRSIAAAPSRMISYRNLAGVLHLQGRLEEAAQNIRQALEIRPSHGLYSNLGTLLFAQGLYPQAADAYHEALNSGGSNFPILWMNLGDAHRFIPGSEEEARTAYRRASQLLEDELRSGEPNVESRSRLALVLAKYGARSRAFEEIEKLADQKLEASSLYRLAVACELLTERSKALSFLGQALDLGYSTTEVANDPELVELRRDPAYHRLVARPGSSAG